MNQGEQGGTDERLARAEAVMGAEREADHEELETDLRRDEALVSKLEEAYRQRALEEPPAG